MYVSEAMCHPEGCTVLINRKNGSTISVKKHGGWKPSFKLARQLAGWPDAPDE